MKTAVLSGKGGTGKTTVAVNLAFVSEEHVLIDADIEEPNAALFMDFSKKNEESIYTYYPVVDAKKCTLCGKCGEFCRFNAIIPAKNTVLVFYESCHDCGGCALVCPKSAIVYEKREVGKIYKGCAKDYTCLSYGELNIGELSGVKIIKELKNGIKKCENVIIDSPPGAACAVAAVVEGIDYAVLVTEPTPFGLSDMKIVIELLRKENVRFGVVINKAGIGNNDTYEYCRDEDIEILGEIPFDMNIAKIYSEGKLLADNPEYCEIFENLLKRIEERGAANGRD